MAAAERFESIDQEIRTLRAEHEEEMGALNERLRQAIMERDFAMTQREDALNDRDVYMRIATRLVTQFSTVEAVFAEAKRMAQEANVKPAENGKRKRTEMPTEARASYGPNGTSA